MSWPLRRATASPAETRRLAGRVASVCRAGDVVLLVGDLGTGKTVFAQGFAAALGVAGPVTSPTFALVRQYRCGPEAPVAQLIHADVYRTGSEAEVADLALAELVEEDAVALVEWGDLAGPVLGHSALEVTLVAPDPSGAPTRRELLDRRARELGAPGRRGGRGPRTGRGMSAHGAASAGPGPSDLAPAMVAIETATETVGVAVRTPAGVEAEFALTGRRRHVETLTPALEHLLSQVGIVPGDLGAVAVDVGPGLFTGLRVGVAAAKALAQSLGIGVLSATSLDILTAAAAASGQRGLVLACVDARRGEVFASLRELDPHAAAGGERIAPGLFAPGDLADALGGLGGVRVLAVGDGAQRYEAVLGGVDGVEVVAPGLGFPPPAVLLRLALGDLLGGKSPDEPASVVPLYIREADARSNFARADRSPEAEVMPS